CASGLRYAMDYW
nr:immunoglobulin heavy chain junction region [Mus musculus]